MKIYRRCFYFACIVLCPSPAQCRFFLEGWPSIFPPPASFFFLQTKLAHDQTLFFWHVENEAFCDHES